MKTIMTFQNPNLLETRENCSFCQIIDTMYNTALNTTNEENRQEIINILDKYLLCNGYEIMYSLEKNSYHIYYKSKISEIKNYDIIEYREVPDRPHVIHSRWCRLCASRKLDIYDESRDITIG